MKTTIKLSLALAAAILVLLRLQRTGIRQLVRWWRPQPGRPRQTPAIRGVTINLETILQLNGPKDANVAFIFDEIEEFKKGIRGEDPTMNGLYKSAGVTNGVQNFSVAATVNWKLDWRLDGDEVLGVNAGASASKPCRTTWAPSSLPTAESTAQPTKAP
ncbi:MAG: hypothetical protein IPK21_12425 [Haliscomenobacter sp.]|nr:hypothetical protein [Haliscomenobacter sp.]